MLDVLIGLSPAILAAIIFFGLPALMVLVAAIVSAVVTEFLFQKMFKKKSTITDLSAVVTGVLLAMCLPPSMPWWMVAIGSFMAIGITKQLFGGIGYNIFNPALIGRAFLMASYPVAMTTWTKPFDTITTASPLGLLKMGAISNLPNLQDLFFGNIAGSLGETSALALLLGASYLIWKKVIDLRIPGAYIGTVALIMGIAGQSVPFHLLAGGLILGAFFMATDYTTSPMTTKGKLIFGIGCGALTAVIRLVGGYPEGVCYSILIMNTCVPLIDRLGK
jgi:electron transport complex protein RnfD